MSRTPTMSSVYLFVADLVATVEFYRLLGFTIEEVSPMFARAADPTGVFIMFGTAELTGSYDPKWKPPGGPTKNTINLELESVDEVDETYRRMVGAGYSGHLEPCNPPWEARFAIVEDPDGNFIGLNSPRDIESDRRREEAGV